MEWNNVKKWILLNPQWAEILDLPEALRSPSLDHGRLTWNPYFTGREQITNEIIEKLTSNKGRSVNIFALHGIAGIGKSELAKHIALTMEEMAAFPGGYFWISLESDSKEDIWSHIAKELGIGNFDQIREKTDRLVILRKVLDAAKPFIVLDNADNNDTLEVAYQPLEGQTLLITSRRQCPLPNTTGKDLDDLPIDKAIRLYWNIYNLDPDGGDGPHGKEAQTIQKIVELLACHPLSIEIIARKALRYRWTTDRTLKELRAKGISAIELPKEDARYREERHRSAVKCLQFALERDVPGDEESGTYIRGLFSICAVLNGEFFHVSEISQVLVQYLELYNHECKEVNQRRTKQKEAGGSGIMQMLGLAGDEPPPPPIPDPDPKGILLAQNLLLGRPGIQSILDEIIDLRLVKSIRIADESTPYFGFHPLIREMALGMAQEYFTPNIWKAVVNWNIYKAQALRRNPGQQIDNFRFFLNICADRKLFDEYDRILFAILPYFESQGMWLLALELLEKGQATLKPDKSDVSRQAHYAKNMGEIHMRMGDMAQAIPNFEEARSGYEKVGEFKSIVWINYWMNNNSSTTSTQQYVNCLNNMRQTVQIGDFQCYGGEIESIIGLLDSCIDTIIHNALDRVNLLNEIRQNSIQNLNRLLLNLCVRKRAHGRLQEAGRILQWISRLQERDYQIEIDASLKRGMFYQAVALDDLEGAKTALAIFITLANKQGHTQGSKISLAAMEGTLSLLTREFKKAREAFKRAADEYRKAFGTESLSYRLDEMLASLLAGGDGMEAILLRIESCLSEKIADCSESSTCLYHEGLLAARDILFAKSESVDAALLHWHRSLNHLKNRNREELKWLSLLESKILEIVKPEKYYAAKSVVAGESGDALAPVSLFLTDLPLEVVSQKDQRHMILIPAGVWNPAGNQDSEEMETWLPDYYLDAHPVTIGEYCRFLDETNRNSPHSWNGRNPDNPVTNITFEDAQAYCVWAGKEMPLAEEMHRAAQYLLNPEGDEKWKKPLLLEEIDGLFEGLFSPVPRQEEPGENAIFDQEEPAPDWIEINPWNQGCGPRTTIEGLLGGAVGDKEQWNELLNLLSVSIRTTEEEIAGILLYGRQMEKAQIGQLIQTLRTEFIRLRNTPPAKRPETIQKLEQVKKRWREMAASLCEATLDENPFSDIGSWHLESLPDLDIRDILSLPDERDFEIESFLDLLAASIEMPIEDKKNILQYLSHIPDDKIAELISTLQRELELLKKRELESWPHLSLQKKHTGKEWQNLIQWLYYNKFPSENPFNKKFDWNETLEEEIKPGFLIPSHPNIEFDENHFLNLIAGSISLPIEEKRKIIQRIPKLRQEQIDELISIFEEECDKFLSMGDFKSWKQLERLRNQGREDWNEMINEQRIGANYFHYNDKEMISKETECDGDSEPEKEDLDELEDTVKEPADGGKFITQSFYDQYLALSSGREENPFAKILPCDAFLPEGVDIGRMIPSHPKISFDEKVFLQLISGSISLSANEKMKIITAISKLTQSQIDQLADIFLEERQKFIELSEPHWHQLELLRARHWEEWVEVVYSLHPQLPLSAHQTPQHKGCSFLEGSLWHWTASSRKKNQMLIVGGPAMNTDKRESGSGFLSTSVRDIGEKHNRAGFHIGFRCCRPVYSKDYLKDLIPNRLPQCPEKPDHWLAQWLQIHKPVLWAGAGLSVDAGIPTIAQLAETLWDKYAADPKPGMKDPYQLIDAFCMNYGKGDLEQALSREIPENKKPTPLLLSLSALAREDHFSGIITTNYDSLMESALREKGVDFFRQIFDSAQSIRDDGRLRLMKIHGDSADWRHVILTGNSYRAFGERYRFLVSQLDVLLLQNPILFIGCSMLDERILGWITRLPEEQRESLKQWVVLLTQSEKGRLGNSIENLEGTAQEILDRVNIKILIVSDHAAIPKLVNRVEHSLNGMVKNKN